MASEWHKTDLGQILSFSNGRSSPERADCLPYPVYGSNGIIGYANEANSGPDTIIIGRVGSYCGSLYLSRQSCWVTDNAIRAVTLDDNSPHYSYYLLLKLHLNQWRGGSGQPLLNQSTLRSIPVSVPEAKEQRAIAHILGTLDDKIELNRQMNQTLEGIARALFKSWFVDFDPVRANAKELTQAAQETQKAQTLASLASFASFALTPALADLFPDAFVESELGEIPKGWKIGTVGEGFNITMGQSPPGETYNEDGDGSPFYQGRRDFGFRYPSLRVYCNAPTRFAKPGDTLVSVRAPVGDINMAVEDCCIGRGVAAVRHKTGSRSYTYYAMHSLKTFFDRFEAEGTVFGSLNKRDFHNLAFLIPPTQVVEEFERLIFPIDQLIETNEQQAQTLATLRDTLLPKLISGELRVPEALM